MMLSTALNINCKVMSSDFVVHVRTMYYDGWWSWAKLNLVSGLYFFVFPRMLTRCAYSLTSVMLGVSYVWSVWEWQEYMMHCFRSVA